MAQLQRLVIAADQIQADELALTAEQQHYLQRVLRLGPGGRFLVLDGCGQSWLAELATPTTARLVQSVQLQSELPLTVTLQLALPKGNGFDEVVRQATELGVSSIVPLLSHRTLLQPSGNRLDRWRRIAQEAAEQCERAIVPTICDPIPFMQLVTLGQSEGSHAAYLGVTRRAAPHLLDCLWTLASPGLTLAIGPEGGWTDEEVEAAIAAGYQAISLGQRILRAVTAPIVALSLIAAASESQSHPAPEPATPRLTHD